MAGTINGATIVLANQQARNIEQIKAALYVSGGEQLPQKYTFSLVTIDELPVINLTSDKLIEVNTIKITKPVLKIVNQPILTTKAEDIDLVFSKIEEHLKDPDTEFFSGTMFKRKEIGTLYGMKVQM